MSLSMSWCTSELRSAAARLQQVAVGGLVVRALGQPRRRVRRIEISVKLQSPGVDVLPGNAAVPDGKQAIPVLLDANDDDAITQQRDAREQQPYEVHDVFPSHLAPRTQVLLELLELSEHVAVVSLIDELRQERVSHGEKVVRQRRRVLDERRPQALEHVGVRLERQVEELLQLPVALLALGVLELLRDAVKR